MKKIDLGRTIAILANIGVIAGIVFLGLEIRQNTNATLSTAIQSIYDSSGEINAMLVQNADLRAVYVAARTEGGLESLTEEQRAQLRAFYSMIIRSQQNRYQQIRLGIVEDEDIYSLGGYGRVYFHPFFVEYWRERRKLYSPEFVEWLEAALRERRLPQIE